MLRLLCILYSFAQASPFSTRMPQQFPMIQDFTSQMELTNQQLAINCIKTKGAVTAGVFQDVKRVEIKMYKKVCATVIKTILTPKCSQTFIKLFIGLIILQQRKILNLQQQTNRKIKLFQQLSTIKTKIELTNRTNILLYCLFSGFAGMLSIYNDQFMNINRSAQSSFKQCSFKNENHCEYFESLEQKLLEESEKLASFMRKSTVNEHSRKKLKLAASPARKTVPPFKVLKEQDKFSRTNTVKVEHPKQETTYLKRVKQLCSILRQPKVTFDETMKSPLKLPEKQRQQNDRKSVYNIHSLKEMAKQQPNKQKKQRSDLQKLQKSNKIYKLISDAQSLKDTISTQSCKSIKSIDQHLPKQKCKLDDLQVLKYLAEGKFGSVYLVRHKRTNFMCALKRIPFMMLGNDSKILTQRIRQIKIQSFLDHPNIVQLYSVFVEENDLYLLMELCYSGNLLNHLHAEGRFIEQKIRSVIKQICDAVEFMHDNDILHRDLKPENILFHESIVKICDFGWSVNSPLLRDTLCGTPLYSSPEIVQKQQYDNKIDIWNIGILTYQLLYGKVPFQIRSEEDLSKIIDDDIYFPRSKPASPQIKDFILRCLSKNPKQRFTIAKLVDHQFLNPSNLHQSV